ncbi:EF-hand domain-containing protein [Hansschlegelia quercus]|nr:hypothetical protein [Hansschlegelia quercus]
MGVWMSFWPKLVLAMLVSATATWGTARAQKTPDDPLPTYMSTALFPSTFVEGYIASALRPLRDADLQGDGLDSADVEIAGKRAWALARSRVASEFVLLDLNGDGSVTADERARAALVRRRGFSQLQDRIFTGWDSDHDGVVTLSEALSSARPYERDAQVADLMRFDADGDGKVQASELEAAARRAFAKFDLNNDGLIDHEESQKVRQQARRIVETVAEDRRAACELPPPGKDDLIVAFGVYEGNAIPTVTVAGQDKETTTAKLEIEPGDRPLYVVVSSYDAMIWQVAGATSRMSRLVLISSQSTSDGRSAAGATGLPGDKVTIAGPGECRGYFDRSDSPVGVMVRNAMTAALGRAPDVMAGAYSVISASVPSLAWAKAKTPRDQKDTPAGYDPQTWLDASRYTPGGVVEIDPAAVVSASPAASYEVLPGQMGLARLVSSGELVRENNWFKVVKPIPRFPAGLGGAMAVSFVIAKGVPAPAGSPGHSCVTYEDPAGPPPVGAQCRPPRGGIAVQGK